MINLFWTALLEDNKLLVLQCKYNEIVDTT